MFKGTFKLYYDGVVNGLLKHTIVSVPYAGVMVPNGGAPIGLGTGTATINKIKCGVPVYLDR